MGPFGNSSKAEQKALLEDLDAMANEYRTLSKINLPRNPTPRMTQSTANYKEAIQELQDLVDTTKIKPAARVELELALVKHQAILTNPSVDFNKNQIGLYQQAVSANPTLSTEAKAELEKKAFGMDLAHARSEVTFLSSRLDTSLTSANQEKETPKLIDSLGRAQATVNAIQIASTTPPGQSVGAGIQRAMSATENRAVALSSTNDERLSTKNGAQVQVLAAQHRTYQQFDRQCAQQAVAAALDLRKMNANDYNTLANGSIPEQTQLLQNALGPGYTVTAITKERVNNAVFHVEGNGANVVVKLSEFKRVNAIEGVDYPSAAQITGGVKEFAELHSIQTAGHPVDNMGLVLALEVSEYLPLKSYEQKHMDLAENVENAAQAVAEKDKEIKAIQNQAAPDPAALDRAKDERATLQTELQTAITEQRSAIVKDAGKVCTMANTFIKNGVVMQDIKGSNIHERENGDFVVSDRKSVQVNDYKATQSFKSQNIQTTYAAVSMSSLQDKENKAARSQNVAPMDLGEKGKSMDPLHISREGCAFTIMEAVTASSDGKHLAALMDAIHTYDPKTSDPNQHFAKIFSHPNFEAMPQLATLCKDLMSNKISLENAQDRLKKMNAASPDAVVDAAKYAKPNVTAVATVDGLKSANPTSSAAEAVANTAASKQPINADDMQSAQSTPRAIIEPNPAKQEKAQDFALAFKGKLADIQDKQATIRGNNNAVAQAANDDTVPESHSPR